MVILADVADSVYSVQLRVAQLLQQLVHGGHSLVIKDQWTLLRDWGLQ